MKKLVLAASLFAVSLSASAKTPNQKIREIEIRKNAKCEYSSTQRFSFAFGSGKKYKKSYICDSNEGVFGVTLTVREEVLEYTEDLYDIGTFSRGKSYGNPTVIGVSYN